MNDRLHDIAVRLDRLRAVPTDVLAEIVMRDDPCMWVVGDDGPPDPGGPDPDRQLAADLCAGCTVQDVCIELEFRLHGAKTIGVWGGLSDADRRELFVIWADRRRDDFATGEVNTDDDA